MTVECFGLVMFVGVKQQLLVSRTDPMETWQHAKAGSRSHEGVAYCCCQSRRRHSPGWTGHHGTARRPKVRNYPCLYTQCNSAHSSMHRCQYSVSVYYLFRIEELTCGGMVEQVQEAFGETMTSVVSLCARYPIACANSIGLLCTIPYTRQETSSAS